MTRTRKISLYVTDELRNGLDALSKITGESLNEIINVAIAEYLERNRAEVDRGKAAVKEWEAIINRNK